MKDHTGADTPQQDEPDRFLVASGGSLDNWMKCCPVARTVEGWSTTLDAWVIIANECKRWSCPICGRHKVTRYATMVASAQPNKFITLTCNPAMHENPRAAYDATRRKIPQLTTRLRRRYEEFEFFRVLEVTKKGWPHYHLITRSPYIPQAELSDLWKELTGAPIVDVRKMDRSTNAYWYVVKYLGKQAYIPWTDRRATWTRNFFPANDFTPGESLGIHQLHFANYHPSDQVRWTRPTAILERYSHNAWMVVGSTKDQPPITPPAWHDPT